MKFTTPHLKRNKWMLLALLALLTLLAIGPALAEDALQTGTLELELYSCGALPKETSRRSQYALTSDGVDLETYVVSQLKAQATQINVQDYQIPLANQREVFSGILNRHPELFYVYNGWEYNYSNGIVCNFFPSYKYTGAELQSRINRFNSELSNAVSYASSASTTLGKILLVNDYFCVNYQYDFSYSRYAPDELFIDKTGVCQAYMLAFRAVMNSLGIPCETATSDEMNHTWNMVQVDGSWYHIDVTWNDPGDMPYRACHNNFLLSDSGIQTTDHYGWSSPVSAGSAKYDEFFWREINTPMPVSGKSIYYAVQSENGQRIVKYWNVGGGHADVCSFPSYGISYKGYYPVQLVDHLLCCATSTKLYLYDLNTQESAVIYEVADSGDYIMTGYYTNGAMWIYLHGNSNGVASVAIIMPNMTLSEKQMLLEPEQTKVLEARVQNVDTTDILWESGDTEIAEVDEQGLVTAKKTGVTTITVTCGELSDTCEVLVYQFTFEDLDGQTLPQGHTYMTPPMAEPADVLSETGWTVTSTAPEVARVNADNSFTTLTGGKATITVYSNSYPKLRRVMTITVPQLKQFYLPDSITTLEREAFAGASFQRVEANAALQSIGSRAFADCAALKLICLGSNVNFIADDAFEGCTDVAILCPAGSYAATYAETHDMAWSDSGEE